MGAVTSREQLNKAYRDLLGRDADPEGVGAYMGVDEDRVREILGGSPEAKARQTPAAPGRPGPSKSAVSSIYGRYLGRDVDPSGMATYTADGVSAEDVRKAILASPEYADRKTALGRPPDNLDAAAFEIDQRRRAATQAIADRGEKGRNAFNQARQASQDTERQAVQAALASDLAKSAPAGAADELTRLITQPAAERRTSLDTAQSIFEEDMARRGVAYEGLLGAQAAAIPTIRANIEKELALMREKAELELAAMTAGGGRGGRGGGGGRRGGGGGGGGARGGEFDPLSAQWRANANIIGHDVLNTLGPETSDALATALETGIGLDSVLRDVERQFPGAGDNLRKAIDFAGQEPGIDYVSAIGMGFSEVGENGTVKKVPLRTASQKVRGSSAYADAVKLVDEARSARRTYETYRDSEGATEAKGRELFAKKEAARKAAETRLRELQRRKQTRTVAAVRSDKNLK